MQYTLKYGKNYNIDRDTDILTWYAKAA